MHKNPLKGSIDACNNICKPQNHYPKQRDPRTKASYDMVPLKYTIQSRLICM